MESAELIQFVKDAKKLAIAYGYVSSDEYYQKLQEKLTGSMTASHSQYYLYVINQLPSSSFYDDIIEIFNYYRGLYRVGRMGKSTGASLRKKIFNTEYNTYYFDEVFAVAFPQMSPTPIFMMFLSVLSCYYNDKQIFDQQFFDEIVRSLKNMILNRGTDNRLMIRINDILYLDKHREMASSHKDIPINIRITMNRLLDGSYRQAYAPFNPKVKADMEMKIKIIIDYLTRNNIPLHNWPDITRLRELKLYESPFGYAVYEPLLDYADYAITTLYNFIETQVRPGGSEMRDAADRFNLEQGTLSPTCAAKKYPELEAAALSLLSEVSLSNACSAINIFKDYIDLDAPCGEYEINDLIEVLEKLIFQVSKKELCALIQTLGGSY